MTNNKYAKAYKEVFEIIKNFPVEEYNKIPKEKIKFYKEQMDQNYNFTINPSQDLSEQNISKEANSIIITLYQDYFASEEEKEKIKEILELNGKKSEIEKRKNYNPNNLFNNEEKNNNELDKKNETALVNNKENFFTRFKNFILKLLRIKN